MQIYEKIILQMKFKLIMSVLTGLADLWPQKNPNKNSGFLRTKN